MPEIGFELNHVERLVALVERCDLALLEVAQGDARLRIKGGHKRAGGPVVVSQAPAPEAPPQPEGGVPVTSPMVGVFYRSPGPDQPHFVEPGDHVEAGQTVGLIEAMKVFSEVPSEVAGTILAIPAQNGQLVKPGDALVVVLPGGPAAESQPETA